MFSGRGDIRQRRIDHCDTAFCGFSHINVVDTHTSTTHHNQISARRQHSRVDLSRRANNKRRRTHHRFAQLLRRQAELHIHVVARRAKQIQTRLSNRFRHQNSFHQNHLELLRSQAV